MEQAIFDAVYGALNYQKRLEALSNNLANVNTAGFKEERPYFRIPEEAAQEAPAGAGFDRFPFGTGRSYRELIRRGSMIAVETRANFAQGQLRPTGNPLDLGIDGKGFFCVQTEDGVCYTRKGSFSIRQDGTLVTQNGRPVLGEGGTIQIAGGRVEVDAQGTVYQDGAAVDTLRVVDFDDPRQLSRVGDTLFAPAENGIAEAPAEPVSVRQGYLEQSNVNTMRTMAEMIEVVRGFESYQKIIQAIDDATSKTVNDVGRL